MSTLIPVSEGGTGKNNTVASPGFLVYMSGYDKTLTAGEAVGDVSAAEASTNAISLNVAKVGGQLAVNVGNASVAYGQATFLNDPSSLVKRDQNGNFSAGTISANLTGNASGTAGNVTGIVDCPNGGLNYNVYPLDGQIPIGDSFLPGYYANFITAGPGISVVNGHGNITISSTSGGSATTVVGTSGRIDVTASGGNNVIDIDPNYAGQASISTVGTVTSGTWDGNLVQPAYGGTGVNSSAAANGQVLIGTGNGLSLNTIQAGSGIGIENASGSITISNTAPAVAITGTSNSIDVTASGGNNVISIDPNYAGQASISTVGTVTSGVWNGSAISNAYGGTGIDTSAAANGQVLIGTGNGLSLNTIQAGSGIGITNASGSVTINNTAPGVPVVGTSGQIDVTAGVISIDSNYAGQASISTVGTITNGTWNGDYLLPKYGGTGFNGSTAANGQLLIGNGNGFSLTQLQAGTGIAIANSSGNIMISNTSSTLPIVGTSNRIDVAASGGNNVVNIDPNYAGQASISTVGTVTSGTWNGSKISSAFGGTGLNTSTASPGELLIGTGNGLALGTLLGGANISITNTAGEIMIAAANPKVLISSTVLSSNTPTITLSNISNKYTHLHLDLWGAELASSTVLLTVNGVSTASYDCVYQRGVGSSNVITANQVGATAIPIGYLSSSTVVPGLITVDMPFYASGTWYKSFSFSGGFNQSSSTVNTIMSGYASNRSTSAISSITLQASGTSFRANTICNLYGCA